MAYTPTAPLGSGLNGSSGFSGLSGSSGFSGLASDGQSLNALRGAAARDPKAATTEAARQFESLFMQELLKSMRQATLTSGMLDNEGTKLGTEMLDQQLATKLTGMPGGLSEAIARQLQRQMGMGTAEGQAGDAAAAAAAGAQQAQNAVDPVSGEPLMLSSSTSSSGSTSSASVQGAAASPTPRTASPANPPSRAAPAPLVSIRPNLKPDLARLAEGQRPASAQDFVASHQQAARQVESQTGIPAAFMLAQAAHETGWGRKDIRLADGSSSNNLFGIKAGADWKGPVAEVTTTEFIDGVARKVKARFRAYASSAEAFADYARLMTQSPRYKPVVAQARTAEGFAEGLQKAGYATDPEYAAKLSRVINTTLRLQRSLA